MGSQLIIFFFTVGQREPCGMPSSTSLVFVGLCHTRLRSFWLVGSRVAVPRALLFEKWSFYVSCGVFGVSETIDVSRIPRGLLKNSSIFSYPFLLDSGLVGPVGDKFFLFSLPFFLFPLAPLCIPPMY
jgi:hypothetical protein